MSSVVATPRAEPQSKPSLSIVVPVYQAADTLADFHDRLTQALKDYPSPIEIILVDDGSRNRSWPLIRALAEKDTRVRGSDGPQLRPT